MTRDLPESETGSTEYSGPAILRSPIFNALRSVVDPELSLPILDIGLVYGVTVQDDRVQVRMTMTSPACPVTEVIVADLEDALDRVLPEHYAIQVEIVWEPPWEPARMTPRARTIMGW